MLYRVVDAVDRLNSTEKDIRVGVINKASVNLIDEEVLALIGASQFVVCVESWSKSHISCARVENHTDGCLVRLNRREDRSWLKGKLQLFAA